MCCCGGSFSGWTGQLRCSRRNENFSNCYGHRGGHRGGHPHLREHPHTREHPLPHYRVRRSNEPRGKHTRARKASAAPSTGLQPWRVSAGFVSALARASGLALARDDPSRGFRSRELLLPGGSRRPTYQQRTCLLCRLHNLTYFYLRGPSARSRAISGRSRSSSCSLSCLYRTCHSVQRSGGSGRFLGRFLGSFSGRSA